MWLLMEILMEVLLFLESLADFIVQLFLILIPEKNKEKDIGVIRIIGLTKFYPLKDKMCLFPKLGI
jgi:hypothetical protein